MHALFEDPLEKDSTQNPIRDILTFERQLKRKYNHEVKRRLIYFVMLVNAIVAYTLYVSKKVYGILWDIEASNSAQVTLFLFKVFLKMLGCIILISFVFIKLLRASTKILCSLSEQLRLLNIYVKDNRIYLCPTKTPPVINKTLLMFREEEHKRRQQWTKKS
ncbi:hypothetical protein NEOKW01_0745 [Nematocida sp. AWRm80]|nr:hypothetical protein NEOKW01_0745 [Nematocida sp. AWRm80]